MTNRLSILEAKKNNRDFIVEWNDGHISQFNYLWLRDNCPSEIHPTARERTFNLLTVTENIQPETFSLNEDSKLTIKWNEGDHTSEFSADWLRKNCYTLKNSTPFKSPYTLWDNTLSKSLDKIKISCEEIMDSDDGVL